MSIPTPLIQTLNSELFEHVCSFLDEKSLAELSQTSHPLLVSLSELLKTAELLDCVVNVNEEKRSRILEILNNEKKEKLNFYLAIRGQLYSFGPMVE